MVIKSNPILKKLPHHPHQNKDFMDSNGYKDAACLVPHPQTAVRSDDGRLGCDNCTSEVKEPRLVG